MKRRLRFGFLFIFLILMTTTLYGVSIPRKPRYKSYFVSYISYGDFNEWVDASKIICRVRILSVNSTNDGSWKTTRFNAKVIKSYKDDSLKGSTIVIGIRGIETETEIKEESMNPYFKLGAEEILFLTHQDKDGAYWYLGGFGRYMVKPGRVYPLWGIQVKDETGEIIRINDGFSVDRFEQLIRYYVAN